jgi:hypothetical protein
LVAFTDSLAVTVSDSYTLTVKLAYTFSDSTTVTISDTYTLTIKVSYSFSDSISITITDTYTLTVKVVTQYSFSDSISITISDTYTLTVKTPTSYSFEDSISIVISDTYVIQLPQQFPSGWKYRKIINVNTQTPYNNGLSYYVIKFKLYYGSGTDNLSTFEIYLNQHCRADFGDIRFVSDPDTPYMTLLPYWFEYKSDGNYVIVWVKIPVNQNYTWIAIYYGNENATYVGDPKQVFVFFEDFENTRDPNWVDGSQTPGWYEYITPALWTGNYRLHFKTGRSVNTWYNMWWKGASFSNLRFIAYVRADYSDDDSVILFRSTGTEVGTQRDSPGYRVHLPRAGYQYFRFVVFTTTYIELAKFPAVNTTDTVRFEVLAYGSSLKVVIERPPGNYITTLSVTDTTFSSGYIGLEAPGWDANRNPSFDTFAVTQYVDPEPTLNSIGSEELLVVTYSFTDNMAITLVDNYSLTIKSPLTFTDLININIVDNYIVSLGLIFTDLIDINITDVYVLKTPYVFDDLLSITMLDNYVITTGMVFMDLINVNITDLYILTVGVVGALEFIDTLSIDIKDVYYLKPPKPLPNALVEIYDDRGNLVASGYTDNYGRISFFIPVGKYRVRVSKPFYYPVEFDEELKESKVRKVYLKLYQE